MIKANPPAIGTPVRVHFNLRTGLWSISAKTPKGWRVVHHAPTLSLRNCTPVVSIAGIKRVRRLKRRNVVASIAGTLEGLGLEGGASPADIALGGYRRIRFNPYAADTFTTLVDWPPRRTVTLPWTGADMVVFLPMPEGAKAPHGAMAYEVL